MLLHLKIKSGISWWSPKFLGQPDPTSCSEDQGGNFPVNQTCRPPSYPEWVLPHAVLEVVAVPLLSSYLQYMDALYGKNPILQSFRCFLLKILTWLYPNSTITPLKEGFGRINWFRCEILWNHSKKVGCYQGICAAGWRYVHLFRSPVWQSYWLHVLDAHFMPMGVFSVSPGNPHQWKIKAGQNLSIYIFLHTHSGVTQYILRCECV